MTFYTYVLECENGALYTGWTVDLTARYQLHLDGKGAKYTRANRPIRLCASFEFDTKQEAMKWEWQFKRLSKRQKLEILAREEQKGHEL